MHQFHTTHRHISNWHMHMVKQGLRGAIDVVLESIHKTMQYTHMNSIYRTGSVLCNVVIMYGKEIMYKKGRIELCGRMMICYVGLEWFDLIHGARTELSNVHNAQ